MDMILDAHCKINLGLDVLSRRDDGYHEVRMIMQSLSLADKVSLKKNNDNIIRVSTSNSDLPPGESNLAYKAAKAVFDRYSIAGGVDIFLEKNIPMAAGLAGGSADAAAVIKGVAELFDTKASIEELMKLAAKIGADVPFCIKNGLSLCEGIGEILTPLTPIEADYVLLIKPDVSVSTAQVYGRLELGGVAHPDIDMLIKCLGKQDFKEASKYTGNVLESVTLKIHPYIKDIKNLMKKCGAYISLMSGSGPTVFGIFPDEKSMNLAYKEAESLDNISNIIKTSFLHV